MTQALECLRSELGIEFTEVDVDTSPELVRLYDTRVPVLVAGDIEICHYFLEEGKLREHLQSCR
jgi:thioredoxin reductase (NADPH)